MSEHMRGKVSRFKAENGPPVFFIEREDLFDRPNLYGPPDYPYYDNLERFVYFNRAAIVTGPGALIGDGSLIIPTVESVHARWDDINSLSGAKEFSSVPAAFASMLDVFRLLYFLVQSAA